MSCNTRISDKIYMSIDIAFSIKASVSAEAQHYKEENWQRKPSSRLAAIWWTLPLHIHFDHYPHFQPLSYTSIEILPNILILLYLILQCKGKTCQKIIHFSYLCLKRKFASADNKRRLSKSLSRLRKGNMNLFIQRGNGSHPLNT